MKVLAIETSCDESAVAIAEFSGPPRRPAVRILANLVSSQAKLHAKYGGVVPNLAKREHQKNLVPILLQALTEAELLTRGKSDFSPEVGLPEISAILEREPELLQHFKKSVLPLVPPQIDAIAITYGPGLAPALWVGVNFARALAYLWKKPLIPVNHMEGHLYSPLLQSANNKWRMTNIKFPALALLVSGGHTELVLMRASASPKRATDARRRGHGKYKILGETLDDAAGEAFDKVARLLDLPYPGGPEISKLAEKPHKTSYEVRLRKIKISLPRPMLNSKDYNFSFSGLKTAVLYLARDMGPRKTKKLRPAIAKEFQDAVVEVLVKKTLRAAKEYRAKTILLGGGVAANALLREKLAHSIKKELPNSQFLIPHSFLCGDNALMIAVAAYFADNKKAWRNVHADANASLGST